jgi:hypothetical protein
MHARWGSFAVGLALILAPLLLGYATLAAILRDVSTGLLVCIATLAALDRPALRFALAAPALWLLWSARSSEDAFAGLAEAIAGAVLLLLAPIPSGRRGRAPRLPVSGEGAEQVQARA